MDSLSLELRSHEVVTQVLTFAGIVLFSLLVALFVALGEYLLAAVLLGGISFTVLFFSHPKIAVIILLLVRFNLHIVRLESFLGLGVDGILNLVTIVLGGFYWLMNHERIRWPKEMRFLLLLLAYIVASVMWSVYKIATIRLGLRVIGYFVLFMLVAGEFRTRKDLRLLLNMLFIASIPNVLYAMYGFLRNPGVFVGAKEKLGGLSYTKPWTVGDYAMTLGTILIWMIAISERVFSKENILRGILLVMLLLILVLSKTRAAMIAFILSNGPVLFFAKIVPFHRKVIAMTLAILFLAALSPYLGNRFRDLRETKTAKPWHEHGPDNSFEWRRGIWASELRYLKPYVLLGTGYGSIFWYNAFINIEISYPVSGHGEYLQNLIEIGILGWALWLGGVISILRYSWRRFRRWSDPLGRVLAVAPALIAVQWLLIALVDDFLAVFPPQTVLFCLLGMARSFELYVQPAPEEEAAAEPAAEPARARRWSIRPGVAARPQPVWGRRFQGAES